jgi:hypothetical protein
MSNDLSWSPDGTKIVYEGGGGGFLSILDAADGSGSKSLVANGNAHYPSWVPAVGSSGGASAPGGSGAGASPTPLPAPLPSAKPKPTALVCKKGKKKNFVKGKATCVKRKHHKAGKKP